MKKFSVILLSIFSILVLVACKDDALSAKISIESITPARTSVYLVLKVEDPKEEITEGTIEAKVYNKDNLMATAVAKTDDEGVTTIEVTGLSIGYEYKLEIHVTADKKGYKLAETTFKTSTLGASTDNPKLIKTLDDLKAMETDVTAYYRLENDIDFSSAPFLPLFQSVNFQGNFDGNGKSFKNIIINQRRSYTAIFGRNNGTIKDLNLENVTVSLVGPNSSSQYVGLLTARNTGTINNVTITSGEVILDFNYVGNVYVGGLTAYNDVNGKILNSNVTATFNLTAVGRTEFSAGGFAGRMIASTITNSTSNLTVNLTNADSAFIGGAVGYVTNSATLKPAITKSKADLTLNATTAVTQTSKVDNKVEVIQVSIGGFVGRAIGSSFNEVYANSSITLNGASNQAIEQSSYDTYALGGFAGSLSSSTSVTNALVKSNLVVGSKVEETINGFDRLYVGSIAGEAYNTSYDKVLAVDSNIESNSNSLLIALSPLNGNVDKAEVGAFDSVTVSLNNVDYINQKVVFHSLDNLETFDLTETSRTDYFTSEFINTILNSL